MRSAMSSSFAWVKNCSKALVRETRERLWASQPKTFSQTAANQIDFGTTEIKSGEKDVSSDRSATQQPEDDFRLTPRLMLCLSVLYISSFISAVDYTSIGTVVSTISADLRGTTTQSEWIGNGYSLTSCVAQLPISALSDAFGRRALVVLTLAMFLIGSIVCGTAQNMHAMIAGRIIQGIGSAGNLVLPEVVLAETIPLRLRGNYYAFFMFIWALGAAVGPVIAGAFAEYATWRWMFYLNFPICGIALALAPFLRLKHHSKNWREQLAEIDYVGALLVIGSASSLVLGLGRGGSSDSLQWSNWSVILPLVLGGVGLVVTGLYDFYSGIAHPMFNIRVFGNMSAAMCYIQNVLQGIIVMAAVFYLPTFFEGAKGMGQLMSGVAILPLSVIGPPVSLVIGYLITRTGHYALLNCLLWALSLAGVGILMLISEHRSLRMLMCIQIPGSIGLACLYATLSITVNACNPPELWVDSTAMMSFSRGIGDTFGTAVGGAIFASQMKQRLSKLAEQGISLSESTSALTVADYVRRLEPGPLRDALVHAIAQSMRTTYTVLAIFTAVGFATCFLQREYSLDQSYEPRQGIILEPAEGTDTAAATPHTLPI